MDLYFPELHVFFIRLKNRYYYTHFSLVRNCTYSIHLKYLAKNSYSKFYVEKIKSIAEYDNILINY